MTDQLTAFSADGHTARWRSWDDQHVEHLTLRWENEGWTATGELERESATYVVRLSATWHVRQFLLFRDLDQPDLWLGTDGAGNWGEVNGARRPDLHGCTDVTLPATPFSRTIAIRRLELAVGASAHVLAARVDVDTLGVVPEPGRYTRLGPRRFEHVDLATGEVTVVDVDEYGLVHDEDGRFRRQ